MKKTLLIIVFAVLPFLGWGQSTTNEEYAYLTKGMAEQKKNGLDFIKNGYNFEVIFEAQPIPGGTNKKFIFRKFETVDGDLKAISIETVDNSKSTFACFPVNNQKLLDKFASDQGRESSISLLIAALHMKVAELKQKK